MTLWFGHHSLTSLYCVIPTLAHLLVNNYLSLYFHYYFHFPFLYARMYVRAYVYCSLAQYEYTHIKSQTKSIAKLSTQKRAVCNHIVALQSRKRRPPHFPCRAQHGYTAFTLQLPAHNEKDLHLLVYNDSTNLTT